MAKEMYEGKIKILKDINMTMLTHESSENNYNGLIFKLVYPQLTKGSKWYVEIFDNWKQSAPTTYRVSNVSNIPYSNRKGQEYYGFLIKREVLQQLWSLREIVPFR